MSFRMFLALQLMMFLVLGLVGSWLSDVALLQRGVVMNFAVFYLASMLVGYTVKTSPVAHALAACAAFYLIAYLLGDPGSFSVNDQIIDALTAVVFVVIGANVGIYSRPRPSDEDVVN